MIELSAAHGHVDWNLLIDVQVSASLPHAKSAHDLQIE